MLKQPFEDTFEGRSLKEVQRLQESVLALGHMIENAIQQLVEAIQEGMPSALHALITLDHQMAKKRLAIELDCVTLIASERLSETNLPTLAAMLEITTELERMGDYVVDISSVYLIAARIGESWKELLLDICRMGAMTGSMLRRALEAFVRRDVLLAQAVHTEDEGVDMLYRQVYDGLLTAMKGESRTMIKQARYLARIASDLERCADRVTNICEWVTFAVTGELMFTEKVDEPVSL